MLAVKAGFLIANAEKVYKDFGFTLEQGKIREILPNKYIDSLKETNSAMEVIDAQDKIVLPGFVNAHMHQYGMLSHGIPVHVHITGFWGFLEDYWWPYVENRLRAREVCVTAEASAVEMIRSGVTSFCDTLEAPYSVPGVLEEQARVVEKTGLRAVLSIESCERITPQNGMDCIRENSNFIEWCRKQGGIVSGMMCVHTTFTCSADFLKAAKAEADRLNARWQFHLSESIYEPEWCLQNLGKRPVQFYHDLGLLDSSTLASQCVQVDEEEIKVLAAKGVGTVHMPLSNCEVGGGVAPIPHMLQKGLNVGLGSDGYINDFFTVMKGAFLIHKANQQNPSIMPAREVFRMATELGARALGWENTGVLAPGKDADFIIIDNKFPTPLTEENIFDQLVVFGQKEYVNSVFTAGRRLMKDGELLTIDEEKAMVELRETANKFWEGI